MNRRKPLKRTELERTPFPPRTKGLRRTGFKRESSAALKRTGTAKSRKASASTVIPKPVKDAVDARDQHYGQPQCQRCGHLITGWFSRHHRDPRAMGGSKADPHALVNLVLLCGSATSRGGCHAEVENGTRKQAYIDGWLVPMGIRPDEWPARRFGRDEYQLPGETGWTVVPPHPLQVQMGAAA